ADLDPRDAALDHEIERVQACPIGLRHPLGFLELLPEREFERLQVGVLDLDEPVRETALLQTDVRVDPPLDAVVCDQRDATLSVQLCGQRVELIAIPVLDRLSRVTAPLLTLQA